ncbi:transcription factor MAMYB-like [Papaver somniferum]|uniref:transcription factor MAMYB-like n=1 Tax=Papaver somniferum TaxID=3469 RepID=UPI000E6FE649|nr:transcription factor MAMYB-like [Papaver somniferum]XP_026377417.1 transcription factor MAMYB-like [Papaver somniferum]
MEFLDEESRPSRFMFQSKASTETEPENFKVNKTLAVSCIIISVILIITSIFVFESETLKFIVFWFSLSLIVGPFAPNSITAGDIRVGQGQILEPLNEEDEADQTGDKRRGFNRKQHQTVKKNDDLRDVNAKSSEKLKMNTNNTTDVVYEEKEWVEEDFEMLKKQILKHPVGEPKRWELITEAFQGRHGLESVIKMGKSLSERKVGNGDSFSQFLKQRKPLDKRLVEESNGDFELINDDKKENSNWTSAEDVALLNALKAFPKDVATRWEKIAVAVPGGL